MTVVVGERLVLQPIEHRDTQVLEETLACGVESQMLAARNEKGDRQHCEIGHHRGVERPGVTGDHSGVDTVTHEDRTGQGSPRHHDHTSQRDGAWPPVRTSEAQGAAQQRDGLHPIEAVLDTDSGHSPHDVRPRPRRRRVPWRRAARVRRRSAGRGPTGPRDLRARRVDLRR